jgi:hypothetical protein
MPVRACWSCPGGDGASRVILNQTMEPAMNIHDVFGQFGFLLLGRLSDVFDLSFDTWVKIAAVVILWVYMILGSGRESAES